MLSLARRSRGKRQGRLASEIGISQGLLAKYEAGTRPVSEAHLRAISSNLDYPTGFFTKSGNFESPGMDEIFHRKRKKAGAGLMDQAYAVAHVRRLEVAVLLESTRELPAVPRFPIDEFEDDPAKIARTVRASWKVPRGPIFNVTRLLEDHGCIVVPHDFGTSDLDGFSHRSSRWPPFFHINYALPPDRWRWTLAHELGHVVMHFDVAQSSKEVEEQANIFASEFLAPSAEILPMLWRLDFPSLASLKREWKISMQSLIMIAHRLGAINSRQKTAMFTRLSAAGYRSREPENLDPPVERPHLLHDLAGFFLENLEFSRSELRSLMSISQSDFRQWYGDPEDILSEIIDTGSYGVGPSDVEYGSVSISLGPSAPALHIQLGCHPEDVVEFQEQLDALNLLQKTGVIHEKLAEVTAQRVVFRLSQQLRRGNTDPYILRRLEDDM